MIVYYSLLKNRNFIDFQNSTFIEKNYFMGKNKLSQL